MSKVIEEAWQQLAKAVYPASVSRVQYTECRRAFYAGANALLTILASRLSPDKEPTAEDAKIMEGIEEEFIQYAKDLQEGKA